MEKLKRKYQLNKFIIGTMKKFFSVSMIAVMCVALALFVAPCLLVFSVGSDGELSVWNLVGIGWCLLVYYAFKKCW